MYLIVGLGNPGQEHEGTRHNIGRDAVLALHRHMDLDDFRFEKKWNAQVAEGRLGKEKIALILPDTFMNKSGTAVASAVRFFKAKPDHVFLVHDDADIMLGNTKMSFSKRSAGHKGVESVMRALKTRDFWRFRLGIAGKRDIPAEKIVLKRFTPDEQRLAKKNVKKTVEALDRAVLDTPEIAMNEYNA